MLTQWILERTNQLQRSRARMRSKRDGCLRSGASLRPDGDANVDLGFTSAHFLSDRCCHSQIRSEEASVRQLDDSTRRRPRACHPPPHQ